MRDRLATGESGSARWPEALHVRVSGQVKDSARNQVSDHEYRLRQVADLALVLGVLSTGSLVYDLLLHR
jgi:hypothetical protein